MRIAIVCTVPDGGMVHFAQSCFAAASDLGHDVLLVLPENSAVNVEALTSHGEVVLYALNKGLSATRNTVSNIQSILELFRSDSVWLTDETVTSSAMRRQCGADDVVFIHDVKPHLAKMGLKTRLRFAYLLKQRGSSLSRTSHVIVMSNTAKFDLEERYGEDVKGKVSVLRLGATVPECETTRPLELTESFDGKKFFLFFGAIEKYKNVAGLVKAFTRLLNDASDAKLIIAGKGRVGKSTLQVIAAHQNSILLINRYISDEELVYLMNSARATLLPYREATQSGVLPISYKFKKPVVTSSAPGLAEFVIDNKTGYVVDDEDGLVKAMANLLDDTCASDMGQNGFDYAECELNFTTNVASVIASLSNANCEDR